MQGRARLYATHPSQACARVTNLAEGASDGHDRGGTRLHGRLRGQGLPHAHGAPPPVVPGARLHHGARARHHSRDRRPHRNGDAAAVHLQHGPLLGVRAAARPGRDDRNRRPHPGGVVRRARRCRLGGNGARRFPHGEEGRGRTRAQRRLHVLAHGRRLWCGADGHQYSDPAPGDAVYRFAGAVGLFRARHFHGGGPIRQCAAAWDHGRLPRRHDCDDRDGSANGHAALDLRQPLSLGRLAAHAAAARRLCAAGAVRPLDRPGRDFNRHRDGQHLQGPMAGREGLLQALVAHHAMLVDRRRHRLHPRHQRVRRRLARLRPCAQDREGRQRDIRQGRRAGRDRIGKLQQRQGGRRARSHRRLRRPRQRHPGDPARCVPDPRSGARSRHADQNLSITYAMVWSVALANILGAGLCYAFSPQFAKLATLRYTLILPAVLGIIYIGAFEATRQWGDLFTLLFFGLVGWLMKQFKWPRPPLILGVVLGDTIERYLFISIERYGLSWMLRPIVVLLFALAILGLVRPFLQDIRSQGGVRRMLMSFQRPTFHPSQLFTMFMIALIGAAVVAALRWDFSAKIVPLVVGTLALCAAALSLFNEMCRKPAAAAAEGLAQHAQHEVGEKIHMDLTSDTGHLPVREIVMRGALFFGYLIGFMAVMAVIGLIPTVGVFVVFFMRYEARERWQLVIPYAVVLVVFIWFAFDYFMAVPWPPTLIGQWFPALKAIPSV